MIFSKSFRANASFYTLDSIVVSILENSKDYTLDFAIHTESSTDSIESKTPDSKTPPQNLKQDSKHHPILL